MTSSLPGKGLVVGGVVSVVLTAAVSPAFAQNYSFDARRIALGGAGGTPNVASKLVERQRRYNSILIPIGLVKVLSESDPHVGLAISLRFDKREPAGACIDVRASLTGGRG